RHACDEGWIHVVPTRVAILGGPPTLTVEEAGAAAGLAPEFAAHLWRTLRLDRSGYRECVDADVAIFELYAGVLSMFGGEEPRRIGAVQGPALGMMADAEVAQVRALPEAPQRGDGADNVAVGDMWVEFVRDFLAVVERGVARLHRHQILATGRRYTL